METRNIKLGQVYIVETPKGELPIRLERMHPKGGWMVRNSVKITISF